MILEIKLRNGDILEVKCEEVVFSLEHLNRVFGSYAHPSYWFVDNHVIRSDEILYLKRIDHEYKKMGVHNDGD